MRTLLLELIDYDRWATEKWLDVWGNWKDPKAPNEVLGHLLAVNRIWLERCGGTTPAKADDPRVEVAKVHEAWVQTVCGIEPEREIAYRNLSGVPNARPFEEIVRHLANHNTYHRGELRRLAADGGMESWPDTDLLYFYDARR